MTGKFFIKVKRSGSWKPGYRMLQERIADHRDGRAIRFRYYRWLLWIPAKAIFQLRDGTYMVPYFIIDYAKDHPSARFCDDQQSAKREAGIE